MQAKEPCVIDDKLIMESIWESDSEASTVSEKSYNVYSRIWVLAMSYKNIIKI